MPINVSEAICSDTAEKITVVRTLVGGYVGGIYVAGSTHTFKTLCSVQQPTPQQLQTLPEGERSVNNKLFISKKLLRTTQDKDNLIADVVIYKGIRYKITSPADWDSYGYTGAIGVRD